MTTTKKPPRTCMAGTGRKSYCGRTSAPIVPMQEATCADCHAAFRADEAAAKRQADR